MDISTKMTSNLVSVFGVCHDIAGCLRQMLRILVDPAQSIKYFMQSMYLNFLDFFGKYR